MQNTWDVPGFFSPNLGDPTPGSWGGHCVNDPTTGYVVTSWGRRISVTPTFDAKYASEGHVIINKFSADAFTKIGNGKVLALADLVSDLQKIQLAS